jgi:Lrp/AsnC family leucine-responsive transcriptional regulator
MQLNSKILNYMKLDKFDKQILDIIQKDGKISNQDLAEQVGLSPSPCLRRVKALEDAGIIVGYRGLVDAKKLGLGLIALIQIAMDKHTQERFEYFESEIKAIPEVLECLLITGQTADYLIKVVVQDLEHYQRLLLQKITKINGVTGVHSSFVLSKVVDKTALPIY